MVRSMTRYRTSSKVHTIQSNSRMHVTLILIGLFSDYYYCLEYILFVFMGKLVNQKNG